MTRAESSDAAMTLDGFQQAALRTINPALNERDRLIDAGAGLAEEAAEVLGLIRKRTLQGREISPDRLTEELGDALWCLAITAHSLGLSLSTVAAANQQKLRQRHPAAFSSSPNER
jgi:NTP pyrophosphatase (non-canonical NTP hydrolase)